MAKQTLPVDFQDDLLNVSMGEKRRYRMINNSDGTVSLEDVTVYDRIGSNFGAGQINATNQAVNESFDKNKLIRDLDTINALTEEGYAVDALSVKQITNSLGGVQLGIDGEGNRGYFGADDRFIPFKSCDFELLEHCYIIKSEKTYSGENFIVNIVLNYQDVNQLRSAIVVIEKGEIIINDNLYADYFTITWSNNTLTVKNTNPGYYATLTVLKY